MANSSSIPDPAYADNDDMPSPTTIVDDPEKGTLEVVLPAIPVQSQPSQDATINNLSRPGADDEKKGADLTVVPVLAQKSSPPSKKPKRRVSRWIRFQLWFNTYR